MNRINGLFEDLGQLDEETYVDEGMLLELLSQLEESIQEGDIDPNVSTLNEANYAKFVKANKMAWKLFGGLKKLEVEAERHLSFATTTAICERFGFASYNDGRDKKDVFLELIDHIDYLGISSGPMPTQIMVTFCVNDVFSVKRGGWK